jgi:SNF2 family DNA or RNA helicase
VQFFVEPWAHQREGFERAKDLSGFGLFYEMGAGKTMTAINILRWKYMQHKRLLRTLILGPPIVGQNWKREFEMHSKVGKNVYCLEGSGKKRIETFLKFSRLDQPSAFVTNYESLLMTELYQHLVAWQPEVIVFDESHKLKNLQAKRTKAAIRLADIARYKLILTGTPILNTPMDIFAQYRVMDGGKTFGKNFFVFRAQYFVDKNAGMPKDKYFPAWVPRQGALEELQQKLQPTSMVVKKADCLDLPPLVRQQVHVELSKEQAKLYNAMRKDFIAYVGDKACVATLAITKALRLQQIVSGFITLAGGDGEDPRNVHLKENPRAQALQELLSEITPFHKCLVWAVFRENYATIRAVCDALGVKYVEVHGEVAPGARQKAVDAFNSDPDIRVFLGHPGSAGIGINLVGASYSIFYSRTFSLEQDLQAEARNYRGGSEIHEKVTRLDLVATGTIDEAITAKLASKIEISDKVLRDIAQAL